MQESSVYTFNPLIDRRWPEFVQQHPGASVFHTRGWLSALQQTYHYEPIAFTTSAPGGELKNGLVCCAVRSWLTGRRLVSLPFSDHCEPLIEKPEDLAELVLFIEYFRKRNGWKYVELRPAETRFSKQEEFRPSETYYLHRLNLRPGLDVLLNSCHKDCVQRKIRKAQREELEYEVGRNESLLRRLYGLVTLTRRRHSVPPQPFQWFRNLVNGVGDGARIRIASKDARPVAGTLTLQHRNKLVYKYGGSDASLNYLGGMPFLFWKSIEEGKLAGCDEFDLGRTDTNNPGLVAFKDHFAAQRVTLTYWRCQPTSQTRTGALWKTRFSKKLLDRLPDVMFSGVGRFLYRHIG